MNNNGARPGDDANPCELDIRCFTASLAPRHNEARFFAYLDAFTAFLEDDVRHPQELVSLLHDTHWPEVPQALAVALYRTARKCKIRFTLVEEFGKIYEYVVFSAFASCEPDVVATWFLQNTDTLIRGTIAALLTLAQHNVALQNPLVASSMRIAFRLVIGIAGAVSNYTTVTSLRGATGPHVVLVVSDDENNGSYICLLYTSPSPRDGLLSRMPSSA